MLLCLRPNEVNIDFRKPTSEDRPKVFPVFFLNAKTDNSEFNALMWRGLETKTKYSG